MYITVKERKWILCDYSTIHLNCSQKCKTTDEHKNYERNDIEFYLSICKWRGTRSDKHSFTFTCMSNLFESNVQIHGKLEREKIRINKQIPIYVVEHVFYANQIR